MKRPLFWFRTFIEHHLKNLGLYYGVLLGAAAILLWLLDKSFFAQYQFITLQSIEKINNINTTLSSLLISVLLTSFSVVFVVMQLASSQFSPRILRYFLYNNIKVQQFIGLLLGATALIYLPFILNAIVGSTSESGLCTLVSVVVNFYCLFISFPRILNHLSDNMNVASLTNLIKNETVEEIEVLYAQNWEKGDKLRYNRHYPNPANNTFVLYWKGNSGYLSKVDYSNLSSFYTTVIKNTCPPHTIVYQQIIVGEFITSLATPMITVESETPFTESSKVQLQKYFDKIAPSTFIVNKYRSNTQDINFGVRKLVDIAIKAISPAVNDPTTCLNCVDYIGEIVRVLAIKKFPSTLTAELKSEDIYINEFNFEEFVDFSFDQIYQWGKKDPTVVKRLISTIRQILPSVNNPYHLSVLVQEIEEMELHRIYSSTLKDREHTLEQIKSIQKELDKTAQQALKEIERLENLGILPYQLAGSDLPDTSKEKKSIQYLQDFKQKGFGGSN